MNECMVFHIFTSIDRHLLPWVPEAFFSLEATEMIGEAAKASREAARKSVLRTHKMTSSQMARWLSW